MNGISIDVEERRWRKPYRRTQEFEENLEIVVF